MRDSDLELLTSSHGHVLLRVKVDLPIEKPLRGRGGGRGGAILRIQNGEELGSRSSMNSYPLSALTVA